MVLINAIRVRLAVAVLINSVIINVKANIAAGTLRINMDILFTNRKLPSIHSESVSKSRSKASTYCYAKETPYRHGKAQTLGLQILRLGDLHFTT